MSSDDKGTPRQQAKRFEKSTAGEDGAPEVPMTVVACGGDCGKQIQTPVAYAELMERTGRPALCSDCREKQKRERPQGKPEVRHEQRTAPGDAPVETVLTITYRSKAVPPDPDRPPGFSFKLVPGGHDQATEETQLLMKIHTGLTRYIAARVRGNMPPEARQEMASMTEAVRRGERRIRPPRPDIVKKALGLLGGKLRGKGRKGR